MKTKFKYVFFLSSSVSDGNGGNTIKHICVSFIDVAKKGRKYFTREGALILGQALKHGPITMD